MRMQRFAPVSETLYVHFYGGPGTGKSTTTALAFGALKKRGHNVEMAHEYAKDLTWEQAFGKLSFQPYVTAKQMWRMHRLEGQVDAVLTDTSTLLAFIYGTEAGGVTPAFKTWVLDEYRRMNTLNIFLERNPERFYNPKGRNQTKEAAEAADAEIKSLLDRNAIPHTSFFVDKDDNYHVGEIVTLIESKL